MSAYLNEILTQPASKIVFNAPYDVKASYRFKILNHVRSEIVWEIESAPEFLCFTDENKCGLLGVKSECIVYFTCDSFQFDQESTNNSEIVIRYVHTNNTSGFTGFDPTFFETYADNVEHKNLAIQYNSK